MIRAVLALAVVGTLAGARDCGAADGAFPFDLGHAGFDLVDQHGHARGAADPDGRAQLLFFGYANCEQICSAALPLMAETVDMLDATGHPVTPVMITVDPVRDTAMVLKTALGQHHRRFVGLTGSDRALGDAYRAFSVEVTELFRDPAGVPVYAHGSFLYLLDGAGQVLTVIPPVLPPQDVARIVTGYLTPDASAGN